LQILVDDLIPGMELLEDIRLRAGSFLITRKELSGGCLNEDVIESIRKFSAQLSPDPNRVLVKADEKTLGHLKSILDGHVARVAETITSGKDYPNFMGAEDLREKVLRVMDKIVSNPDIITNLYSLQLNRTKGTSRVEQIMDHSIRVCLLAISLGLRLRLSIVSLVNLGMAASLHDMGMLRSKYWPELEKLDDVGSTELEEFVREHQDISARLFSEQNVNLLPHTRNDILSLISSHHRIDLDNPSSKTGLIMYLADLIDEMISLMPYRARFCFTPVQIHVAGDKMRQRTGLLSVLTVLVKLTRGRAFAWDAVTTLAGMFALDSVLVENYEEKLRSILEFCPFKCSVAYPHLGGNSLPRTVYCRNSLEPGFSCEFMGQVKIEIITPGGQTKSFFKCSNLTDRLHELNKQNRD